MKLILFFAITFFSLQTLQAQDTNEVSEAPVLEAKDVDVQPEFPGGIENCYTFFYKNFKKPEVPELIGKIFLGFIVETDGSLTDIRSIKDPGFGTGAEAERVLQLSPKWVPGKKDGKRVRVRYILPIGIHTE
ncbi:energy transducer TonB [Flavobacterium sp.]|uniref:energy transducer TonB n=1 Tax=Flavobacterium sp. TaxID=239 RepID=UPI0026227458|nr:energy transducer TonB [Flavobacterium sp.]